MSRPSLLVTLTLSEPSWSDDGTIGPSDVTKVSIKTKCRPPSDSLDPEPEALELAAESIAADLLAELDTQRLKTLILHLMLERSRKNHATLQGGNAT